MLLPARDYSLQLLRTLEDRFDLSEIIRKKIVEAAIDVLHEYLKSPSPAKKRPKYHSIQISNDVRKILENSARDKDMSPREYLENLIISDSSLEL